MQGYPPPMWPMGFHPGSPFSGSPLSDYGPMQQLQHQQAMQGLSRHQQVRLLTVFVAEPLYQGLMRLPCLPLHLASTQQPLIDFHLISIDQSIAGFPA